LVGLPLADAEALLHQRGREFRIRRPIPKGAVQALGPYRGILTLMVDDHDVVKDVCLT
jgi:hypothetical protein